MATLEMMSSFSPSGRNYFCRARHAPGGSNNGHNHEHGGNGGGSVGDVNIEAIGEDVKACNNAMTTLVQIFSIAGQDSNSTMKDATDKLKELLVAIRSVVTKYQANFDAKATQDILDRTTLLKEFIISLDYDNMADTFQDDLYNLVDKLALSVRSAFLTILTGFDGLTGMTRDPTPEIALDRSKVASHYLKHLADYMEWRARLEMEFANKLAKHAEKYRAILSADPYLPLQSTFVTSLERTQEYADQLIQSQKLIHTKCVELMLTTRQVHEEKRKRSKAEWKLAREGYHEAVLDLKNTEDRYRHYLNEHRRAQNRTREEEGNLVAKKTPMAKVEKRQQQEEDAAKKLKAAEAEYRAKIDVANQKQLKIKDETSNTAKELQESLTHIDEIVRQTGSHYFSLQHTVLIPHTSSLQSLRESAKGYTPGRQLAEYMRDEMPQEQTVYKAFEFTPNTTNVPSTMVHDHDTDDSDSDNDSTSNPVKKGRSIIDTKIPSKIRDLKLTRRERVFGGPLKDAAKNRQPKVPFVVSRLIHELDTRALKTRGIYRVNGVKNRVELICSSFTMDRTSMDLTVASEHDMSSVLKRYLHDLPQPLFTHALYPRLLTMSQRIGDTQKMSDQIRAEAEIDAITRQIGEKLTELPEENYATLQLIISHLRRIADNSSINMMGPKNLGTVFGPTLMRAGEDKGPMGCLMDVPHQSRLVELLIERIRVVFPQH